MSFTYHTLKSAIIDYSENNGEEFASAVDGFIEHACRAIAKDLDIIDLNVVTTVSSSGSPFIQLPSECLLLKSVANISGTTKTFLKRRPYDFIVTYSPDYAVTGTPLFYDRMDSNSIYVGPTLANGGKIEVRYATVSIPTSSSPSSLILTRYPDLVLYKCMVEANMYMKDTEDAVTYGQLYERTREAVDNETRRNRRDDTASVLISNSTPNSLKGTV